MIEKLIQRLCRRRHDAFIENLKHPKEAQLDLREQLFNTLLKSPYGKQLNVAHWPEIPIVNYRDVEKWIETSGLTHSPVIRYVETSGSTCRSKQIPYTADLKHSFFSMFKIWAYDLLKNVLNPDTGKIFMSLSPPGNTGLKDDTQYLNLLFRWLLKPYIILPPTSPDNYQENVARALLSEKDLGIISIWNPSYLLQIIGYIEKNRDKFEDLIGKGPLDWANFWPKLQLVSCWTDGWASLQSEALRNMFPHAILQGKGLLSTEAPMTVPLQYSPAPVPLVDEVYFEFEDPSGNIMTLDSVCVGQVYELIISQKGGLVRYRIGDKVQISGRYLNTPCLTFIGRAGKVCDMVGEKLDSISVETVLKEVIYDQSKPSVLLPVYSASAPCHYILLTEFKEEHLAEKLELALQKIYHYRVARLTGQLDSVRVMTVEHLIESLHQFYRQQGINGGDIKDTLFISDPSQAAQFLHYFILSAL